MVQIITEQETGESPLFNNKLLAKFIRLYDDTTRDIFVEFLEENFQFFTDQQKAIQEHMEHFVGQSPVDVLSKMTEQNVQFWNTMQENFLKNAGFPPSNKNNSKKEP